MIFEQEDHFFSCVLDVVNAFFFPSESSFLSLDGWWGVASL